MMMASRDAALMASDRGLKEVALFSRSFKQIKKNIKLFICYGKQDVVIKKVERWTW
jgi:hypothetical protein